MHQPTPFAWPLLVLGCIASFLFAGCSGQSLPGSTTPIVAPREAREVVVWKVERQPWPDTVRVQGSFLGDDQAQISTKLAGRVQQVLVDLGSSVQAGDPLVVLDRRELQLRIEQAEAMLESATSKLGLASDDDEDSLDPRAAPQVVLELALVEEAEKALARAETLLRNDVVTRSEYENLQANLRTAQARYEQSLNVVREQKAQIGMRRVELELARKYYQDAEIAAPFDGVVERRQISPGEYVNVGDPLVTLVRIDRLRFTAGVPERRAHAIRTGLPVHIWIPGESQPLSAAITRVSPTVNQASRSVRIEADLANLEYLVQSGLFVEADILVDSEAQTLALPQEAIMEFAGVEKVWLVTDGAARQQTVTVGRRLGERVEILDGLTAGDLIVARASDGVEGPVTAVDASDDARLQADAAARHEAAQTIE